MWKINELKKGSRKVFKKNVWTLLFLGMFITLIIGEYFSGRLGYSNIEIIEEVINDKKNGVEIEFFDDDSAIINKYIDEAISQFVSGNMTSMITTYNEKNNITKGVFFSIFNIVSNGQQQLQNFINSISEYEYQNQLKSVLVIFAAFFGMLVKLLIADPVSVGANRIYLESINYENTKITRILFPFKNKRYWKVVKTMLLKTIYKTMWNFTIIGGFIKGYSYKMVPYIIAENPDIEATEAIKISRTMMDGNKKKSFLLDFSFMGWNILQYITLGLLGIFVTPYYSITYAELYKTLRSEYIQNKKYNFELLNDAKLYEENDLKKYPDISERPKVKIDYNKNYELTSIILFFFIFAFVGWIWEVVLILFQQGVLANRGVLYGPWLPIYGVGCTLIILLTGFKSFRKILKKPFITFSVIMVLCTVVEYITSWWLERKLGVRYWDYTGIFLNINGRVCFESTIFFGIGGSLCVYIVAPLLEKLIQRKGKVMRVIICIVLLFAFCCDLAYSSINPHTGKGITEEQSIE